MCDDEQYYSLMMNMLSIRQVFQVRHRTDMTLEGLF